MSEHLHVHSMAMIATHAPITCTYDFVDLLSHENWIRAEGCDHCEG